MYNQIIFYILSALIVVFAFLMLKFENLFYSLLCAICVFFLTSGIFYILGSEYNAVIQLAVYGFAVPVILGIGIMFTDFKRSKVNKSSDTVYLLILACGIFMLAMVYLILTSKVVVFEDFNYANEILAQGQSIQLFSRGIFVKYVWVFELVSVILTITAAGLTIFKKEADK